MVEMKGIETIIVDNWMLKKRQLIVEIECGNADVHIVSKCKLS